ncbi:MAG: hypothetical protein IKF14_06810 [Atopobiaceae bacterium]|nr:hypothetical protein [Atopobiaceae bacterium]
MPTRETKGKSERTTMTISITFEDKKALKQAALDKGVTVSALIHEWVEKCLK